MDKQTIIFAVAIPRSA